MSSYPYLLAAAIALRYPQIRNAVEFWVIVGLMAGLSFFLHWKLASYRKA